MATFRIYSFMNRVFLFELICEEEFLISSPFQDVRVSSEPSVTAVAQSPVVLMGRSPALCRALTREAQDPVTEPGVSRSGRTSPPVELSAHRPEPAAVPRLLWSSGLHTSTFRWVLPMIQAGTQSSHASPDDRCFLTLSYSPHANTDFQRF